MHERRFEELVRDHERAVHTFARSMASNRSVAEDAVQETFLRAWQYLDSFTGSGSFEGWLIRICRRCIFDLEARERRAAELTSSRPIRVEHPDSRSETMLLIGALPVEQREVLVLCGVLGYDYETAARVLDTPLGTIRSRLHRGREALRQAMDTGTEVTA